MKKTILSLGLALISIFTLNSCSLTVPVTATSNQVGSKVGIAKTVRVLSFFPDGGDASIRTAAKNGGISKISTVDVKHSNVFLYILGSIETIVTGE